MNGSDIATQINQPLWQWEETAPGLTEAPRPAREMRREPQGTLLRPAGVAVGTLIVVGVTLAEHEGTLRPVYAHCTACEVLFPLPPGGQPIVCPACAAPTWDTVVHPSHALRSQPFRPVDPQ